MKKIVYSLTKMHITTKITITNVFVLLPFFFIALFLFNHPFIEKINSPLIGSIYFWFFISLFSISLFYPINDKTETEGANTELMATAMLSILLISFVILLNCFLHLSFFSFILLAFALALFILIIAEIYLINRIQEKTKPKKDKHKTTT